MNKGDFIKIIVDPDCESGAIFNVETTDKEGIDLTYEEVLGIVSSYIMPDGKYSLNWLRKKKVKVLKENTKYNSIYKHPISSEVSYKFNKEDIEKVFRKPVGEFWKDLDKTALEVYNKMTTVKEISHYNIYKLGFNISEPLFEPFVTTYKRSDGVLLKYHTDKKCCHVEYKNSSGVANHYSSLLEFLIRFKEYAILDEASVFGIPTNPKVAKEQAPEVITREELIEQGFKELFYKYLTFKDIGTIFFAREGKIFIANKVTNNSLDTKVTNVKEIREWVKEMQEINKKREERRILKEEKAKEKQTSWLSAYETRKWEEVQRKQKEMELVFTGYDPDGKFKSRTISKLGWEPRNEYVDPFVGNRPRVYGYKSSDLQDVAILEDYGNVKKVITLKEFKYLDGIDCDVMTYQGLEDATRKIRNAVNDRISETRLNLIGCVELIGKRTRSYSMYQVANHVELRLKHNQATLIIAGVFVYNFNSFKHLKEYVERVKEAAELNADINEAARILAELEYVQSTPKDKKLEDKDFKMLGWDVVPPKEANVYKYKGTCVAIGSKEYYSCGSLEFMLHEHVKTLEDLVNLTAKFRIKMLQALKVNGDRKS